MYTSLIKHPIIKNEIGAEADSPVATEKNRKENVIAKPIASL